MSTQPTSEFLKSDAPPGVNRDAMVQMLERATQDVFTTMLGIPVAAEPAQAETGDPSPVDGVVALVGIAGAWTGTGRIHCSPAFACRLAGALLASEFETVNEEVLDAISEIANMIIGNAKTLLEEKLGPLGLSVPTVIFGRNYHARTGGIHEWIVVPFLSDADRMEIRFCLDRTQIAARSLTLGRPEAALV